MGEILKFPSSENVPDDEKASELGAKKKKSEENEPSEESKPSIDFYKARERIKKKEQMPASESSSKDPLEDLYSSYLSRIKDPELIPDSIKSFVRGTKLMNLMRENPKLVEARDFLRTLSAKEKNIAIREELVRDASLEELVDRINTSGKNDWTMKPAYYVAILIEIARKATSS